MAGEKNLETLLQSMKPELTEGEYVFCSVDLETFHSLALEPICVFRESEGITLVLNKEDAELAGLEYSYPSRMITLTVYSSLEAVGFLAAITSKLAKHRISVNPVSAYYHDHLFVPSKDAERALKLLQEYL
jgi:hypothetical protein